MVRESNSGHQLLLPPANWCPMFASRTTQSQLAEAAETDGAFGISVTRTFGQSLLFSPEHETDLLLFSPSMRHSHVLGQIDCLPLGQHRPLGHLHV